MFRLFFMTFTGSERLSEEARRHLHESSPVMTVPLLVLAILSVIGGYVGLPAVFGVKADAIGRFLEPVVGSVGLGFPAVLEWNLILVATAAALGGLFVAYLFYIRYLGLPGRLAGRFPRLYRLVYGKYFVDEIYDALLVRSAVRGAEFVYDHFDLPVIDGALNGSAGAAGAAGRGLSRLQTGLIKDYALSFLLGIVVFVGVILFWAR
jgi:NADH-quinone oxidoreductase subunit L